MQTALSLRNLSKRFVNPLDPQDSMMAVKDVSFDVRDGEFLTMVGAS